MSGFDACFGDFCAIWRHGEGFGGADGGCVGWGCGCRRWWRPIGAGSTYHGRNVDRIASLFRLLVCLFFGHSGQ